MFTAAATMSSKCFVGVRGYQGAISNNLWIRKIHKAHDMYREEAASRGDDFRNLRAFTGLEEHLMGRETPGE